MPSTDDIFGFFRSHHSTLLTPFSISVETNGKSMFCLKLKPPINCVVFCSQFPFVRIRSFHSFFFVFIPCSLLPTPSTSIFALFVCEVFIYFFLLDGWMLHIHFIADFFPPTHFSRFYLVFIMFRCSVYCPTFVNICAEICLFAS